MRRWMLDHFMPLSQDLEKACFPVLAAGCSANRFEYPLVLLRRVGHGPNAALAVEYLPPKQRRAVRLHQARQFATQSLRSPVPSAAWRADNATRFRGASRSDHDPSVRAGGNADDSVEADPGASANAASFLVVAVADHAAHYQQQRLPSGELIEQPLQTQPLDEIRFDETHTDGSLLRQRSGSDF